jgi:hypothetical protein
MHPIKRAFLITFFSLGTIGGFASGFAHLGAHCASHHQRRAAFEDHVANVCTRAAQRADGARPEAPPQQDPYGHPFYGR